MNHKNRWKHLELGVCYYPEAWPQEYWEKDLRTMLDSGITCIRIAEFTWTIFEPEEGVYSFDLFDRFLDLCKTMEMRVIFCTPTAIPPIWMSEKYPEILNADIDGHKYYHGFRRHCNYSSSKYYELSRKIVEQLAKHYGNRREIIGWQIDNEFNCENNMYHSEADHAAFRDFVKQKYKSLDALNAAWGTVFWNQSYTDWSQIYLPRRTVVGTTNPHLMLEEKIFISHQIRQYCKMQADILRACVHPDCFITHNGIFDHLDSHKLTEESLDFMAYDSYPNFAFIGSSGIETSVLGEDATTGNSGLFDRKWSRNLSAMRSISPHFIITEQQCGPGGSYERISQATPKHGQLRLWTFQSIAHGADLVSYFRWRTTPVGSEMYWHGFFNYNMTPTPRLEELKEISHDIKQASSIAGSGYVAKVAIVRNYLSDWDGEKDNWHGPIGRYSETNWVSSLQYNHSPYDYLYLYDDTEMDTLRQYDILIVNRMPIVTEKMAGKLKQFVLEGGKLIIGPRNGYKDQHGRCYMKDMPGYLSDIAGITVKDFSLVSDFDDTQHITADHYEFDAPVYYETLHPVFDTVTIAGTYLIGDFAGMPAITCNKIGRGEAWYVGTCFTRKTADYFVSHMRFGEIASSVFSLPQDIEIAVREKENLYYFILLNYKPYPLNYEIKVPLPELLSGNLFNGNSTIEKYGVQIFSIAKSKVKL